ncbi:MAG TPA: aminomethyl-transferring glycine dehydrogenase subunit GcvPA [Candidatus Omnitrophica bacterium]|nr:aminomethyl-transferring glycine dehydrogenase subunit GcvPA [Candidatus Omnitrophota bacterium]
MYYLPHTEEEIKEMLKEIGVNRVEELYSTVPSSIRLKQSLNLESSLSEKEVKGKIEKIAQKNHPLCNFNSFLGAGCYQHYLPNALKFILSRSEFTTSYTPYQAECSQGTLQALYEYQSYICLLTGMEASNASLLDGASSLAEAVLMSLRITRKKKVLVAKTIHPRYRQVLSTYLSGFNFLIQGIEFDKGGFVDLEDLKSHLDSECACFCFQNPNFFGLIEDVERLAQLVKEKEILPILVVNPLSLAILKEPASLGVEIVCGDGQILGGALSFGGPSFGFLATKEKYLRQIPGRIVGETHDLEGKRCFCLTLQTREQHIRRGKATSNICSNQSLNAIACAVYLSLLGKEEFYKVALYSLNLTHYLFECLKEIKRIAFPFQARFFNEFVWQADNCKRILEFLYKKKIIAGYYLGADYPSLKNAILSCCTEIKTKEEIDEFVSILKFLLK